jgi:hypothetical protein
MRQGNEARMQAAGVEEEEEEVVVEAIVSVDMERGLDMAAARGFIALPRARAEVVVGRSNSRRGRLAKEEGTRLILDRCNPAAGERSYFVQLAMLQRAARQLQSGERERFY